ncbi:Uncharacterised protein [Mycobacteroides abscessus subsp. massiliense]|nr:Uncharacterised protein [Mycobacteroides abscessus subsp. massiliense]
MRGITSAPSATPSGCAIWRMPITVPRWLGGNHPTTTRPLAELHAAADAPPNSRKTPVSTNDGASAAANAARAVSARPLTNAIRSPNLSMSAPHAMSVSTIPKLGIADSSPALARSRPRSVCKAGMRNATPLMKTLAAAVDPREMASIAQRRAVPTSSTRTMSAMVPHLSQIVELLSQYMGFANWPSRACRAAGRCDRPRSAPCRARRSDAAQSDRIPH